eukprot:1393687-Amorphochlora_amoeboformis.AAC.2
MLGAKLIDNDPNKVEVVSPNKGAPLHKSKICAPSPFLVDGKFPSAPPGLFSPHRSRVILNGNAARRAASSRKMRRFRQALADVKSIQTKPLEDMTNKLVITRADPSTTKPRANFNAEVAVGTPQHVKTSKKLQTATPLSMALQDAFAQAETKYPAKLTERDILVKDIDELMENINSKSLSSPVRDLDSEKVQATTDETTRNLADAFGQTVLDMKPSPKPSEAGTEAESMLKDFPKPSSDLNETVPDVKDFPKPPKRNTA